MGFDLPQMKLLGRAERERPQQALDRFDHFLVRSEHDVRTLARASGLREDGCCASDTRATTRWSRRARQEADTRRPRVRGPLAEQLGIDRGQEGPAVRADVPGPAVGRGQSFELPFDVEEFAERFGDRYTLLIRSHYLNQVVLPPSVRGKVIDVSQGHDITPLLALADGLITDYSSLMFDYALLDRPDDLLRVRLRGVRGRDPRHLLRSAGQGAGSGRGHPERAVRDGGGLKAADCRLRGARERFATEFGEYDKGTAAQQIVAKFFTPGSGK